MAGNLEKLSVKLEANISQYKKDLSAASTATKGWASDTDKAGQSAEAAAKKSQGAFSRISTAIKGTRSEAKKGAEFKVKTDDSGLSKIASRIKNVRGDADKGADFKVRANDTAFSKITSRIKAVRSDANKGASFNLKANESGFSKIGSAIKSLRGDANKGADFKVRADEGGFSGIMSRIRGVRGEAGKGATMKLGADTSGLKSANAMISDVRGNAGKGVTMKINADDSELKSANSSIKAIGETAAGVAGGMALEDFGSGIADNMREASMATGGFEGRLGASKKEAEALSSVGKNVFKGAWGESLGEVNQAVTTVAQGLGTMGNAAKTQRLTEQALTLSDAYGIDVWESTEAVRQMQENLGVSATEAYDLMFAGAQKGANKSDDLADTLREYSPLFSKLGLDGERAMDMIADSTTRGLWDTDKFADSIKEFQVNAAEGTARSAEGFKLAGLNAKDMSMAIAKGGPTAEKAFDKTVNALLAMEDPVKQQQAGVALFGTMYEDVGTKGLRAMRKTGKGMKESEGATKRAGDSLYDNFTTRMTGATRSMQTFVSDAGLGSVGGALSGVAETAGFAGLAVIGLGPALWGVAAGAWGLATAGWAAVAPFAAAALPFAIAGAAIAVLAGGFFVAYNKSERFRAGVDKLDTALIGNKNTAEITKNGWKGLGNVASDNSGISILWAKDLNKLETEMRQNKEAATPFNKAMLDLSQRMRDNKGISGGLSGIWRGMRKTMTDNKGVSDLWTKGTGNLTSKLRDNKGASGALKGAWTGLKSRAMDNKGASAAWAGGLTGLKKRLTDQKGISGAVSQGYRGIKKSVTDNKGASAAWSGGLKGLGKRLTDTKGISGTVRNALGGLRVGQDKTKGSAASMGEGIKSSYQSMKKRGLTFIGGLATGAVNRFGEMRQGANGKTAALVANTVSKLAEQKSKGLQSIGSFVQGGLSKYTEMRKGGATRFEALRGAISGRLSEAKKQGISRTHEMGTELKASWGRQWENAKDKFSGIRGTIGSNLSDAKDRGIEHMRNLGGGLRDAFGRFLEFTGGFGDRFKTILGDKFGGAINKAREWLGGLMKAVANVLGAFGADGLSGDARSLGNGLQEPLKFARGGITNPKDGYGIVGEAGQREAVVNLEQRTPESVAALRAANASPNAGATEDRGHRGLPEPPGAQRRRERECLEAPLTKSTTAGGGVYTGWDHVNDSGGYASYSLSGTRYSSAYSRALDAWDDGRSPIDMRTGGGVSITDGYLGAGQAPASASSNGTITNNLSHMAGYTTDQNDAIATHEVGHTIGLGHGIPAPSIMNYSSTYDVGGVPTENDWMYLQKLWGAGSGGGGKSDPSGEHKETDLKNYSSNFDSGTQPHVARVANYMNDSFPAIDVIGGYRPGDPQDHGKGLALDLMTGPLGSSGANNGLMDSIATHMKANWDAMALTYLISRQRIDTGGGWQGMEDRGSATQNHMDHVHASFSPNAGSGIVSGAGGGGGGGGFDWMGAITSGLAKVGTPEIGLGMVGDGMKSYAGTLLGKAKDFLIDKAKNALGGIGGAVSKLASGDKTKVAGWMAANAEQRGIPGPLPVMTALTESELTNVQGGDRDSLGYFQQRPSQGWGTPEQIMDPEYSLGKFLDAAAPMKGQYGDNASGLGSWAQAVQRSAYPDRYATRYDEANQLIGAGKKNQNLKLAQYMRGGSIPGPKGKEVMVQAHAGERVLSERNNVAFERLANSVELWSSRQQGAKAVEIRETGDSSGEMPREELRAIRSELAAMRQTLAQEIGNEVGGKLMGKPGERNQLRHNKNVNERHKAAGLIA